MDVNFNSVVSVFFSEIIFEDSRRFDRTTNSKRLTNLPGRHIVTSSTANRWRKS